MSMGIGLRLQLIADFSKAANQAKTDLQKVVDSFKAVATAADAINPAKVIALTEAVTGLGTAAVATKLEVKGLAAEVLNFSGNTAKAVLNTKDLIGSVTGLGTAAKKAATNLGEAGVAATKTGAKVKAAMQEAAASAVTAEEKIFRLTTTMTNLGNSTVIVDRLGQAFTGLSADALRAADMVKDVERQLLRLPSTKVIRLMIETNNPPGYGPYGQPTQLGPGVRPSTYGPIPQPSSRSAATGSLTGQVPLMLSGGTDPYFNARAWYANQRAQGTSYGSGPTIVAGGGGGTARTPVGTTIRGTAKSMVGAGDKMQSIGFAGLINALLVGSVAVPAIKSAANNVDLERFAREAFAHKGGSEESADVFFKAIEKRISQTGGNFSQNIGGIQNFLSALPLQQVGKDGKLKSGQLDLNNPAHQKMLIEAYNDIVKLTIADTSSFNPLNTGSVAQDTLVAASNFGFNMQSPQGVKKGYDFATNFMVQMKNKGLSTGAQSAQAMRNIGPSPAGTNPEDLAYMLYILAEGGFKGATAGQQVKRLNTRQAMDPKALKTLQGIVTDKSGGKETFSQYDAQGRMKSPLAVAAEMAFFEKKYISPQNAKLRDQINATVSGGWPIAAMRLLTKNAEQNLGGTSKETLENMQRQAKHTLYDQPAGAKKGERPLDTSTRLRLEENVKKEAQKTGGLFDKEMMDDLKLMTPEITKLLHSINGLISAFSGLNPELKKGLLYWGSLLIAFNLTAGVSMLLIGNFVKVGGAILWMASFLPGIVGFFGTYLPQAMGIAMVAFRALGVAMMANPIGFAIAAITLVATAFWFMWATNWLGTRDITKRVIDAVVGFIKQIPQVLSDVPKNVKGFIDGIAAQWGRLMNVFDSGAKMASQFIDGLTSGFKGGVDRVKGSLKWLRDLFPHSPPADSTSPLAGQEESGLAYGNQFIDGTLTALLAGAPKVKKALKPHLDNIVWLKNESIKQVEDMAKKLEAIWAKNGTVVAKKWITLINPQTGASARVQGDPRAYQRAAVLEREHDTSVLRARTYLQSIRGPQIAANTYKDKLPGEIDMIVSHLRGIEKGASQAARNTIEAMITALYGERNRLAVIAARIAETAAATAQRHVDTTSGQISRGFGAYGRDEESYNRTKEQYETKLANQKRLLGDNLPSKIQLNAQMTTEITERRELQRILETEIHQRDALVMKIVLMRTQIESMATATEDERIKKDDAIDTLKGYDNQLISVNTTIDSHKTDIELLTQGIKAYVTEINTAKVALTGFAKILSESFDAASKSAAKLMSGEVGKSVDTIVGRMLGNRTKTNSNMFNAGMADFIGTFIKSLMGTTLDEMFSGSQTKVAGFLNRLLGGKSGVLASIAESTDLTPGKRGGRVTGPGGASVPAGTLTDPIAATIVPQAGGAMDLGQSTADGIANVSELLKIGVGAIPGPSELVTGGINPAGGPDMGLDFPLRKGKPGLNQTSISQILGGGAMALSGMTTGNSPLSSALSSYSGVSSLFSGAASATSGGLSATLGKLGPYAAAAAAIYSVFAAGAPSRNPANQPDTNQQGYGNFVADLQGQPGQFGNQIIGPAQAYNTSIPGTKSLATQLGEYLSSPGSNAGLNSLQLSQFNKLKELMGGNPNGLGIASSHNDIFTLTSGQQIKTEDYEALVSSVSSMMGSFQNNVAQAGQNADRLAASFTLMSLGSPAGFKMPTGINGAASGIGSVSNTSRGDSSQRSPQNVEINILPNSSLADGVSVDDVMRAINQAIPKITEAVNAGNYQNARITGNYASQTF